jgi:hypothetical protein
MIFEKKKLLNTKYVFLFSLQLLSETSLILRRNERDMIKQCIMVFTQSTLHSCPFVMKLEFSRQIFEKYSFNFMKIRPVGAELFHADGQT